MSESRDADLCPPALTADAMGAADRYTIEEFGIPSFTLMESAGRGCAHRIEQAYGPVEEKTVVVLCGKGNNGGDGLVVARQLASAGAVVCVLLTSSPGELSEDAAHNFSLVESLVAEQSARGDLTVEILPEDGSVSAASIPDAPDIYVDALLGTGLTSAVREPVRGLVEWVNQKEAPVVSVDVPTGLHSDTGEVLGVCVEADRTVTMAAPKVGLLLGDGPVRAGSVEVVDIGIPPFVLDRAAEMAGSVRQTTDEAVAAWWPSRAQDAYKYSVGTALVVGGAPQFTGAPTMAARAAGRSGAGYVQCACPDTVQSTLAGAMATVPTHPLPTDPNGGIVADTALDVMADALDKADAVLVGPGLGRAGPTQQFVRRLVEAVNVPMVVDADGLNALAGHLELLRGQDAGPWILTPHEGEFRRLAGEDVDLSDRVDAAESFARRTGAVCLLKGAPSIVAGPEGATYVSSISSSALASAGTGDVLAGQCVGLLAQGVPGVQAAAAALHLGGAAAERYAATHDPRSMVATDLLDMLPRVASERLGVRRTP